jgi:hypothetical protein
VRQLQLSGNKKLRGVPRRLRALEKWAENFEGHYYPRSELGEKFSHWKIPVLSSLVNPPQTTAEIQARCMNAMLQAANFLAQSVTEDQQHYYRVACLFTLPWMFSSEVTIFYDPDYYRGFFGSQHQLAPRKLSAEFGLILPEGFVERGCIVRDEEEGLSEEWWCIGQPL